MLSRQYKLPFFLSLSLSASLHRKKLKRILIEEMSLSWLLFEDYLRGHFKEKFGTHKMRGGFKTKTKGVSRKRNGEN